MLAIMAPTMAKKTSTGKGNKGKGKAKGTARRNPTKRKSNAIATRVNGCDNVLLDNGIPRPGKTAKFTASADDNFCTNINTLVGAAAPPPEHDILLLILGLGPHLRGYDEVHYALPMEKVDIEAMATDMRENNWKLPPYCITHGQIQGEYRKQTENGWKNGKKRNGQHI